MAFHLWTISEVYSNADGSVQFFELFTTGGTETQIGGRNISSTGAADYIVPSNLSSTTASKSLLFATQSFAELGLVAPDFIIPDGFLSTTGGTLDIFDGIDALVFSSLPTNGTSSLNGSGTVVTNSPTNFDGDSGSIPGNPIVGTATSNTLSGTSGRDFMVGIGGNDTLNGRGGSDTVNGGTGNDILTGGAGNDVLIGGTGKDTASYQSGSASGITLNLGLSGAQATGGAGTDTLSGIERATGSGFADKLTGSNSANVLKGLGGGDTLTGRGGDDTLNGGGGVDKFLFNSALNVGTNVDAIADFAPGIDRIHLDEDIFTALAAGALPPGRFHSVPGATDANDATDRIIYDSADGHLFYDADGTGAVHSAIQFATLTGSPTITAADFLIIA